VSNAATARATAIVWLVFCLVTCMGVTAKASGTFLTEGTVAGIENTWTAVNWEDRVGAEYDPNGVGTMSGSGGTLTCTINDGVGRTDVRGGVGVYYDWYDLEGNQVWLAGSSEADWPFALHVLLEATDTTPTNATNVALVAAIVEDDGDMATAAVHGIGVDFQSATPRRISVAGTAEAYGVAHADMRSALLTWANTGIATSATMADRGYQFTMVTEFKVDKSVNNRAGLNWGNNTIATASSGDGPQLFVGCVALNGAMAGEQTYTFQVAYQWLPALLNDDNTILLPSEL